MRFLCERTRYEPVTETFLPLIALGGKFLSIEPVTEIFLSYEKMVSLSPFFVQRVTNFRAIRSPLHLGLEIKLLLYLFAI